MPKAMPELYTDPIAGRVCALYADGLTCAQVGDLLGLNGQNVRDVLRHCNVPRRPAGMVGRRHTDAAKQAVGDANRSRRPGDWWVTTDGYIAVYQPEHPYADRHGDVRQHRLMMERRLGRHLLPAETVHHINGVKSDNRDENLQLFASRGEHSRHHAGGK